MKRKTLDEYLKEQNLSLDELKDNSQEMAKHFNALNEENAQSVQKAIDDLSDAQKKDAKQISDLTDKLKRSDEEKDEQFNLFKEAFASTQMSIKKMLTLRVDPDSNESIDKQIELALTNESNQAKLLVLSKETDNGVSKSDNVKFAVKVDHNTIKAADTPLLQGNGLGTVTGQVPQAQRKPDFIDQRRRPSFIRNWISNGVLGVTADGNAETLEWVEQANIEETTGTTPENELKNDMHWEYVVKSERAKCLTVTTVVSTRMLRSVRQMQARINSQLSRSLDNELDQQILFGDDLNENFNGIFTQSSAFASGTFAGTIPNANNYDVLRVAINQCNIGSSGTINAVGEPAGFFPTVIAVNHSAMAEMDLSKGSDGHYVLPPFVSADGTIIKGVPVIGSNHIGADQFLVMEGPLVEFWMEQEVMIEVGLVNDQFKRNLRTILAELCGLVAIPENYFNGIITGDFTTAKAALELP